MSFFSGAIEIPRVCIYITQNWVSVIVDIVSVNDTGIHNPPGLLRFCQITPLYFCSIGRFSRRDEICFELIAVPVFIRINYNIDFGQSLEFIHIKHPFLNYHRFRGLDTNGLLEHKPRVQGALVYAHAPILQRALGDAKADVHFFILGCRTI